MGKGTIISGGTDGQYQLQINYDRVAYDAELSKLTEQITEWAIKISDKESEITNLYNERTYLVDNQFSAETIAKKTNEITSAEQEKAKLEIYKLSFEKRKEYLEDNMPNDETMSAWCADLTEDLTGEVGTVEIPGESTHIQIQPGYESNAVYNQSRDGQLLPTVVSTPAQTFYNLAMLPGWQKWKPLFRYGTITAIDGDIADVTLENIKSSQQALEINQTSNLSDVDIEYMSCNGSAFEEGDEVLLKFTGQSWENPVIVGFREEPKGCGFKIKATFNSIIPTNGGQKIVLIYRFSDGSEQEDIYSVLSGGIIEDKINFVKDPITSEIVDPDVYGSSCGTDDYYRTPESGENPNIYKRIYTEIVQEGDLPYPWNTGEHPGHTYFQESTDSVPPTGEDWVPLMVVSKIKSSLSLFNSPKTIEDCDIYNVNITGIKEYEILSDFYNFGCWQNPENVMGVPITKWVFPYAYGGADMCKVTANQGEGGDPPPWGNTTGMRFYTYGDPAPPLATAFLFLCDENGQILSDPDGIVVCNSNGGSAKYICEDEDCASGYYACEEIDVTKPYQIIRVDNIRDVTDF